MPHLPHFASQRDRTIWVKGELERRGTSFAKIARLHGYTAMTLSNAMRMPSINAERAIAAALGVSIAELFPERYDADGNRLHRVLDISARKNPRNVKAQDAA